MRAMAPLLGIFGGTFDPPHVGHVMAVHYVLLTSKMEAALVVPCASHPFGKQHSAFERRLEMCRLAFAHLGERVRVLDIEARRQGPSYTIDTARELRSLHPDAEFELVIGSDITRELENWREIDALRAMVRFRVLPRLEENTAAREGDQDSPFYLPRVSSSGLRALMREGRWEDMEGRIPANVLDYIRDNNLYQAERSESV
jgi:nicotinate-nucleotide adenylyltransferase